MVTLDYYELIARVALTNSRKNRYSDDFPSCAKKKREFVFTTDLQNLEETEMQQILTAIKLFIRIYECIIRIAKRASCLA